MHLAKFIKFNPHALGLAKNKELIINALDNSKASFTILPYMPLTSSSFGNILNNNSFYQELEETIKEIITAIKYKGLFIITIPYIINKEKALIGVVINNKKIIKIISSQNFENSKVIFLDKEYLIENSFYLSKDIKLALKLGNTDFDNEANIVLIYDQVINKTEHEITNIVSGIEYIYKKAVIFINDQASSINSYYQAAFIYKDQDLLSKDEFIIDSDKLNKLYPINPSLDYIKLAEYKGALPKNPFLTDYQILLDNLSHMLYYKLKSINSDNTILGLSGGLDSVLAYLILNYTYQKFGLDTTHIFAYFLATSFTSEKSHIIFDELAKYFKTYNQKLLIDNEFKNITTNYNFEKSISKENIQARLRTLLLASYANEYNGLLIGTSDLSELALGFMTYAGDQISMYSLQGGIPKTIIKALVKHFELIYPELTETLELVINRPISPELELNQDSERIIGKYEYNDFILFYHLKYNYSKAKLIKYLAATFELEQAEASKIVSNFFNRFYKNQFKLKLIAEGPNPYGISLNFLNSLPSDNEKK